MIVGKAAEARSGAGRVLAVLSPSPLVIPATETIARLPPRAPEHRQPGYDEQFDYSTLAYDVFALNDAAVAVGPPLLNLADEAGRWQFEADGLARHAATRDLNRVSRWSFAETGWTPWRGSPFRPPGAGGRRRGWLAGRERRSAGSCVRLTFGSGAGTSADIGRSCNSWFSGLRCLLTKSKDNELSWIRDWIEFHVRLHAVEAVLLYDNGSTRYRPTDILKAMSEVDGLKVAVVVEWPFKWGPHGDFSGHWDSDFAQHGALEHARWRLLAEARGVLSLDIDELAVSEGSVFDIAEASETGAILFPGRWIENVAPTGRAGAAAPRHADFSYFDPQVEPASPKWCAVPGRVSPSRQWRVHWVPDVLPTPHVLHRHFRGITTRWKHERPEQSLDAGRHRRDEQLVSLFEKLGWIRDS